MNPLLKYPGAKWRLADWIISHMPPHECYLEPYLGSGAVFFNKPPSRIETLNDLDGEVVNFFRACREQPEELSSLVALTPWARQEFEYCHQSGQTMADLERARRFAVRCWMAFGASNGSTGWRRTIGKERDGGPDNPKLWRGVPETILQAAERLRDAQIENRPALEVIEKHNGPEVLIYADPPYVTGTRTAKRDQYAYEMTDQEHIELLEALKAHKGMVLLSGYDCQMYRELLPDWQKVTTNTTAELGAKRLECIWLNQAAEYAAMGQQRLEG